MPKRDNLGYKVWFDRGSALAAGLGTALISPSGYSLVTGQARNTVEVEVASAWRGTTPLKGPAVVDRIYGQASASPASIRIRDEQEEWTESEHKRFEELAVAEAVGELGADEAFELEFLTLSRRDRQKPRSGDEVLWEFEQRRLTAELLDTLSRYVEFYEGADPAWAAAGEGPHGR